MNNKSFYIIFLLSAVLFSCRKEENFKPAETGRMTITVSAQQTKAALVDGESGMKDVVFTPGDAISVFAEGVNYKFETAEGGADAVFTGNAPDIDGSYYVASPYKKAFTIDTDNKMHVVIPWEQKATKGSVDPKAMVCAGVFRKGELVFLRHAVSLLKVTVPAGQKYKKIEVACAGSDDNSEKPVLNQVLAGDIVMDESGDFSLGELGYTAVRLVPDKGESLIQEGEYYIAVRPGSYKVTIAFVTEDDHIHLRHSSVANTLNKAHVVNAGELSAASFTDQTAPALLTFGTNVNIALKQLVSSAVSAVTTDDRTITAVNVETLTLGGCLPGAKSLSLSGSSHPVYASLNGTEVTISTSGNCLMLNENSTGLFRNFKALTSIDMTPFSDERVTNLTRAFAQSGFTSLDLSCLKGEKVSIAQYMFENDTELKEVLLNNFSASSLTDFSLAFTGCTALEKLNMESANTSRVSNFKGFLANCKSLNECRLGYYFTISGVSDDTMLNNMWYRGSGAAVCDLYITHEAYDDIAVSRVGKTNFVANQYNVHYITPGLSFISGNPAILVRGRKATVHIAVVPNDLEGVNVSVGSSSNFSSVIEPGEVQGEYYITLEDSMNAREYEEQVQVSAVFNGGAYTQPLTVKSSLVNTMDTGLPIVLLDTPEHVAILDKENWIEGARMLILNPDFSVSYEGTLSCKGRGNNTWLHAKKPYALKLDSKSAILGMKSHKRWCLLANYVDRTLLRNEVAFEISRKTSLAYTPSGKFVELFLNGEHKGSYYLCEQIKLDKNRVNISAPTAGVGDGGYIFEMDSYYDEMFKFRTAHKNLPCQFKDPDEVDDVQFNFMKDYINEMEDALYDQTRFASRDFADYMDLQSFVDFYFVIELTQNNEANVPKSVYMHRDKGGKMVAGPVWDFDYGTFIKDPLMYNPNPDVRRTGYNFMYQGKSHGHYYGQLMQDKEFMALMKERWMAIRDELATIPAFIDQTAEKVRASESINHAMWPIDSRTTNHDETLSFDEAVSLLKEAYIGKYEFLDDQISKWRF